MAEEESKPEIASVASEKIEESTKALNQSLAGYTEKLSDWLSDQGRIPESLVDTVTVLIVLGAMAVAAWLSYVVFRPLVLKVVRKSVEKTPFTWDDDLIGHGVFKWFTHLFPGLLIFIVSPGLFEKAPIVAAILKGASAIYMLLTGFFVVDSLLNFTHQTLTKFPIAKQINLAIFTQVAKLLTALIALIIGIAILIGESPGVLLGGLGVFASILMLVFKDVILGFVAGIQLATNDMLSTGDWLEMPSHSADGDVMQIGLTTVKVRNWDKTITTIPTYALISEPFKNWRGMSESGGRRIKRSLLVDTNSISLCSEETLDKYREIEHIEEYLEQKRKEVAEFNASLPPDAEQNRVNGRRLTNVGTFRAYIEAYLRNHPKIRKDMTLLVRQLAPTGNGLPIEIYCFTNTTVWAEYEGIQADIFDHLFAVAREFDLRIFQQPTGLDFRAMAVHDSAQ